MYFIRSSRNEGVNKFRQNTSPINPMATNPWGSSYPKSALFQEDTSQEVICDMDDIPTPPNKQFISSKTCILIIIATLYLAIIGALVLVLLLFVPHYSPFQPPHPPPPPTIHTKKITRPSPPDPLYSWHNKIIPRSGFHTQSPSTPSKQPPPSPSSSAATPDEPRARVNHRFLNFLK